MICISGRVSILTPMVKRVHAEVYAWAACTLISRKKRPQDLSLPWFRNFDFRFLGLDSLFWIPGFGFLGLDSWVWIPEFGFLGLDS